MCFTSLIESLPPIEKAKDYIESIFYITTAIAAWKGLSIWKTQTKSSAEYELAKKVLSGSLRIRDAIYFVCSPFMSSAEHADSTPIEGESSFERQARETYYAYMKRLEVAYKERAELYPLMIEAETLIGINARNSIENLFKSLNTLRAVIETHFRIVARGAEDLSKKDHLQRHNIIYGISAASSPELPVEETDDKGFRADLEAALESVKGTFSPYITNFHPELKK